MFLFAGMVCAYQTDSIPTNAPAKAKKTAPQSRKAQEQMEAAQQALEKAQYDKAMAEGSTIEAQTYKFAALFRQAKGNPEATAKVQEAYATAIDAEVTKVGERLKDEDYKAEQKSIIVNCQIKMLKQGVTPPKDGPCGDRVLEGIR
jgi:flagellar biosynthesis GTPase FlhF